MTGRQILILNKADATHFTHCLFVHWPTEARLDRGVDGSLKTCSPAQNSPRVFSLVRLVAVASGFLPSECQPVLLSTIRRTLATYRISALLPNNRTGRLGGSTALSELICAPMISAAVSMTLTCTRVVAPCPDCLRLAIRYWPVLASDS